MEVSKIKIFETLKRKKKKIIEVSKIQTFGNLKTR